MCQEQSVDKRLQYVWTVIPPNARFCIDMSDKWLHYTQHGVGCRLSYLERTRLTVTTAVKQIQSDCKSTKINWENSNNNWKSLSFAANLRQFKSICLNISEIIYNNYIIIGGKHIIYMSVTYYNILKTYSKHPVLSNSWFCMVVFGFMLFLYFMRLFCFIYLWSRWSKFKLYFSVQRRQLSF